MFSPCHLQKTAPLNMKLSLFAFICLFSFVRLALISKDDLDNEISGEREPENKRARLENELQEVCCGICQIREPEQKLTKISCGHRYHPMCLNDAFDKHSSTPFKCSICGTEHKYPFAFISIMRTCDLPERFVCIRQRFSPTAIKSIFNSALNGKKFGYIAKLLKVDFPIEVCAVKGEYSALEVVAHEGSSQLLKVLLDSGIKFIKKAESQDEVAFCAALYFGNFENAEYMLTRGVDFKNMRLGDQILLNNLIELNKKPSIKWLIDHGIDVNKKLECEESPLHCAIIQDNEEVIEMLLKAGADIEMVNNFIRTPLFSACYLDRLGATRLLLDHGAKTDIFTVEGYNALHYAIVPGSIKVIEYLIGRSFSNAMQNGTKAYLLHRVAYKKKTEMVKFLLKSGANPYEKFDDATFELVLKDFPNYSGLLTKSDPAILISIISNDVDIVESFLEAGVSANTRIFNSSTSLLHLALDLGYRRISRLLLKHGADLNADHVAIHARAVLKPKDFSFVFNLDQHLS